MLSFTRFSSPLAALALLLLPWPAMAQDDMAREVDNDALIANALSAAPA